VFQLWSVSSVSCCVSCQYTAAAADYDVAMGLAANGTLRSTHIAEWAATVWDAAGFETDRFDVARAANSSLYAILSSVRNDRPYGVAPGGLTNGCALALQRVTAPLRRCHVSVLCLMVLQYVLARKYCLLASFPPMRFSFGLCCARPMLIPPRCHWHVHSRVAVAVVASQTTATSSGIASHGCTQESTRFTRTSRRASWSTAFDVCQAPAQRCAEACVVACRDAVGCYRYLLDRAWPPYASSSSPPPSSLPLSLSLWNAAPSQLGWRLELLFCLSI
jgi:hypothetical protein